ncbi:MAG: hypothetical protein ACOVS5_12205, partial [Oligoflexus sp.]
LEWKLIGRWTETISSDQRTIVESYLNKVGQATLDQIFDETQIPKPSLYKVLSRLTKDGFIAKSGHRRQILYTRSSDLIRLSGDLSDDGNVYPDSARGTYLTKNIFPISDAESDQRGESDQRPPKTADHFSQNDHFSTLSDKPLILSDEVPNPDRVSVCSSDKSSDKGVLSDEADEILSEEQLITFKNDLPKSDQRGAKVISLSLEVGDKVEILVGQFAGMHAAIEGFDDSGQVVVRAKRWLVTHTYAPLELRLVKKGGNNHATL